MPERTPHSRKGRPMTEAMGLGQPGSKWRTRAPKPPAIKTATACSNDSGFSRQSSSYVRVNAVSDDCVSYN